MLWRRHLSTTSLLLALTGACLFTVPQTASAVGCEGADCTGLNPATEGCDADALLLDEQDETGGDDTVAISLKFFRSPSCDASWAKVTVDPNDIDLYPQAANIFYVPQLGGSEAHYSGGWVSSDNVGAATPMVGGDALAKGCNSDASEDQDPAPETWQQSATNGMCTQWH